MTSIPKDGAYRGVPLHAGQSAARLDLVKAEIDRVHAITDPEVLFRFADDASNAPEARILAGAKARAALEQCIRERKPRPSFDAELLDAVTAGFDSATWQDPIFYCSLFDPHPPGPPRAVYRETPLPD